jgi:hypothetical protein
MKNLRSNIKKYGLSLVIWGFLCLLPAGCSRDTSEDGRDEGSPASSRQSEQSESRPSYQQDTDESSSDPGPQNAEPQDRSGVSPVPKASGPAAGPEELKINKFSFRFHKESQKEVCGDWDYFIYKGEMTMSGRLVSQYPIDMTDPDFEMSISTPLESYTLPAVYQRDDHDDGYVEKVIKRKGRGQVFQVKDFRVEDDDLVFRNDDDMTGTYKNHGPLLSATFDLDDGTFEIEIERANFSAYDVEKGEEFEFEIAMPRADTDLDDFYQAAIWIYRGKTINSDDYSYDGDCPD